MSLGARIPKGVLLVGPPGTGKTYVSQSELREKRAYRSSTISQVPTLLKCLSVSVLPVFVTCLIRRKRTVLVSFSLMKLMLWDVSAAQVLGGGHDEREQTLNQLLVEMDGFGSE